MRAHVCDARARVVHWVKVRPICNELVSEEREREGEGSERSQKDCHESGTSIPRRKQPFSLEILTSLANGEIILALM